MKTALAPTRPILRYHGGKWMLSKWVIQHLPPHRVYVEPYGGAASVLMRKPRSYAEVYNDLDGDIVNLFRVLQSVKGSEELERLLRVTPYARAEFKLAYETSEDPIERARRTVIRAFMGFGSASATYDTAEGRGFRAPATRYMNTPTGFRANSNRSGTVPAHDWANYPDCLRSFTDRLRGVTIENRDALDIIRQQDSPDTLYYCDPPYPHSTRSSGTPKEYRHEMTDDDHRALASVLHGISGMAVLSGYACPLYDGELYADWMRVERSANADGAKKRTEVLWLNVGAAARVNGRLALWPT